MKKREIAALIFLVPGLFAIGYAVYHDLFDVWTCCGSLLLIVSIYSFLGFIPYETTYDPGSIADRIDKFFNAKAASVAQEDPDGQ